MLNVGTFLKTAVPKIFNHASNLSRQVASQWGGRAISAQRSWKKRVLQTKQRDAFVEYPR